jgi:hypothetical protein
MAGKKKRPVADDPRTTYLKKRADLDQRVARGDITFEEANIGLQPILDGKYEMKWDYTRGEKSEIDLACRAYSIIMKIAEQLDEGQSVVIAESYDHKLSVINSNCDLKEVFSNADLIYEFVSQRLPVIRRFKPELPALRKILRELKNQKKARAKA